MGNLFSNPQSREILALEKRLQETESALSNLKHLDQDQDGLVSKEEYYQWMERQNDNIRQFKEDIIAKKEKEFEKRETQHEEKMEEMKKKLAFLEKKNAELESKLSEREIVIVKASDDIKANSEREVLGELSRKYLLEKVRTILKNKDINVSILPDYYEEKIYMNVFTMLFGLLDELTKTTSLDFLGHTITFKINAKDPTCDYEIDDDNASN